MGKPLFQQIAALIEARRNCRDANPTKWEWMIAHTERAEKLTREHLPSGGGFDNGTTLDVDKSSPDCLVFHTSFHHMNGDSGMYTEWSEHTVRVRASLAHGFSLTVSGRNVNDIRDYIAECFTHALRLELSE